MPNDVKMMNWKWISVDNVHKNKTIDWSQRDCSENIASWGYVCLALIKNIYKSLNVSIKGEKQIYNTIYKARPDVTDVGGGGQGNGGLSRIRWTNGTDS